MIHECRILKPNSDGRLIVDRVVSADEASALSWARFESTRESLRGDLDRTVQGGTGRRRKYIFTEAMDNRLLEAKASRVFGFVSALAAEWGIPKRAVYNRIQQIKNRETRKKNSNNDEIF